MDAFESALACRDVVTLRLRVEEIVDERLSSGQMKPSGMNVYLRALNSFFSWCGDMGYLSEPLKFPLIAVEKRQRPKILTEREIETWKNYRGATLSQLRAQCLVLLMLDTGLRIEECLGLRESNLDWSGNRVWISRGKGGSNREAPISTDGRRLLKRYLASTVNLRRHDDSFVFGTGNGTAVSYRNSLRDLKSIGQRLGVPWVGWHTFRRTFATHYLQNGGTLTNLQEILGHSDTRTTLRYLGTSIDMIVAVHDHHSPLNVSHSHRTREKKGGPKISLNAGLIGTPSPAARAHYVR
jgi:integrase/recombinase XerD